MFRIVRNFDTLSCLFRCSVHSSWDVYFRNVEAGRGPGEAFTPPPQLQPGFKAPAASGAAVDSAAVEKMIQEKIAITHMIRAYQVRGHEVAALDPLNLRNRSIGTVSELDYRNYGFTEADLSRSFDLKGIEGLKGFLGPGTCYCRLQSMVQETHLLPRTIEIGAVFAITSSSFSLFGAGANSSTLVELVKKLQETYCGRTGASHFDTCLFFKWLSSMIQTA
jgi:2-oxoglutarate dehydrogenase complex dehydrogenase (E1) component-like enzyme